ncbi:ATPase involved in DNA repair [Nostoc sp. DSM 114160]|jgi:ABC-type hemin transport system substrate-binding protein
MSRKKRTSRVLEKAELRSAGLKAIDSNMSFGDDCDLQNLNQAIEQLRTMLDAYNTALTVIDSSKTKIDAMEKTLSNLTDKMVRGVAFKYGKDSSEYEMAGGVRDSERIRKSRLSRLKAAGGEASDKNTKTT